MGMSTPEHYVAQAAAIPFRTDPQSGRLEVLMIRRRDGRKWGIPKGLVDPGLMSIRHRHSSVDPREGAA